MKSNARTLQRDAYFSLSYKFLKVDQTGNKLSGIIINWA